jgi:hypothetical protein
LVSIPNSLIFSVMVSTFAVDQSILLKAITYSSNLSEGTSTSKILDSYFNPASPPKANALDNKFATLC